MSNIEGRRLAQGVLGRLGAALLAAGYAVTDVAATLRATALTQGWTGLSVGVLPGAVLVDDRELGSSRVINADGSALDFAQSAALAELARRAASTPMDSATLDERVAEISGLRPRYPPAVAVAGSGLMSAGIAVVFGTTWWAVGLDALLGMAVGALLIVRSGRIGRLAVTPFLAALAVAVVVYSLVPYAQWGPTTLYVVCAPLVVLIPGATITTAVLELAAGDVVSGGGRFVSGLLIWATLAVGIAAGARLVGRPLDVGGAAVGAVPTWVIGPALVVMAVGIGLFFAAEWRLTALIAGVLLATFGLVAAADGFVSSPVASGIAAAVMLPVCRLLEWARPGWPAAVTYRPAFWLLVPGSLGLVTISQLSGGSDAMTPAAQVGFTVLAIAIGTQVGGVLSTVHPSRRRDPARTRS